MSCSGCAVDIVLQFEKGQILQQMPLNVSKGVLWRATTEFQLNLEVQETQEVNYMLSERLKFTRVKIINDRGFPTDKGALRARASTR